MSNSRSVAAALAGLGLIAAAAGAAGAQVAPDAAPALTPAQELSRIYKLGPGDKLRVTVFGEDNLSGQFTVSSTGVIAFPLIGEVPADGRTPDEMAGLIRTRLMAGYLREPKVAAEVLSYRPFYILGEVNKPGEYPYVAGLTLMKAVATAGGYTYRANTRRLFVRRASAKTEEKVDPMGANIVQPGDTIRVAERFF